MTLVPFDDRDGAIWLDGTLVPWRDAKLHVLSHGLHYASGVFEGERAYAGNIFMLRAHTDRLIESARLIGFQLPWTAAEIDAACRQVVAANGLSDAYVRPIAWRGTEALSVAPGATTVHLAIASWAWPNLFGHDRMRGVRLAMAEWRRPSPDTAPTASKASGLYMIGTLAKQRAEAEGWDDALMLDYRGRVAEGTGANICFVRDGQVHTPAPDCFLDSITRRAVTTIARQHGMPVTERAILPEELPGFTEAFLVGTAAEVTPVRQIGAHAYAPGRITETLVRGYDRLVRMTPAEVETLAA